MAHGDAREGKWRGNWRMEWVVSTLHTTSEHGVSSITTADAHTSAANIRLNWRSCRFKWTRPFRRKTKYGLCACAITLRTQSTRAALANRRHAAFTALLVHIFLLSGQRLCIVNISYRVIKESLCTWRLYYNHQVHRDFLITMYIHVSK